MTRALTILSIMDICFYCHKSVNCTSVFSRGGHLGRCSQYKAIRDGEIEYAMNEEIDDEPIYDLPQIDFNDVLPILLEADELYLQRQRQYQSREIFDSI